MKLGVLKYACMATLQLASSTTKAASLNKRSDLWDAINALKLVGHPGNDFDCRSTVHPNPVVLIHALSANPDVDLNLLQQDLKRKGYCTFSTIYGNHEHLAPWIGGLTSMRDSSRTVAEFILEVADQTGSDKVDLVGHSEGGVMAFYVPMAHAEVAAKVAHSISLGPAIHGALYYGLANLWYAGGDVSRELASAMLRLLGCAACDDMAVGGDIYNAFKEAARIVPAGIQATVIMSTKDTLVAPSVSRVEEVGVRNLLVQDRCPEDPVGHAGLAWDTGVWDMIRNELAENYTAPVNCIQGLPV
ncbi:alpha/beta-hydrolase [Amylocarpus encephaloides]|uniref:Alpha/beta-hydrolase n=1 Tax=Amylocarpus encephaloides TaxID=45428 RepID=A0A9P7Y8K1_9HELO|nr:alpha/beta-hydrolase [Amylocarpus encephaloides]